jgi:hypothetical protein
MLKGGREREVGIKIELETPVILFLVASDVGEKECLSRFKFRKLFLVFKDFVFEVSYVTKQKLKSLFLF